MKKKQTKIWASIFEDPIKILATEVFKDGRQLKAQEFLKANLVSYCSN